MAYELRILRKSYSTMLVGRYTQEDFARAGTTVNTLQYRVYQEIVPKLNTGTYQLKIQYGWSEWENVPIVEDN